MVVSTSEQYSFVNEQRCVKIWNHTQQTRLYTQSAITKFHFRCQMLQTYKATSIIQRQIPPSIHIIRYQSNSKLINHQSSSIPRISHQSNLWDISHVPWLRLGFALALFWQGTKAQQVLDKFCSVKSWICTTASRAMAINTYGHRFDQGYLVGGWPTPLNMSLSVGMMTFPRYGKNQMFPTTNQTAIKSNNLISVLWSTLLWFNDDLSSVQSNSI